MNPHLVETGLTLTMFSDIIFYEVPPVLGRLSQSMRRVWRLGQTRAVTTKFISHVGTVEVVILHRMGTKLKAASMLYGASAVSVLESSDDDELKEEIIRAAMAGKLESAHKSSSLVTHLFSAGKEVVAVSTDIATSDVAVAPVLPVTQRAIEKGVAISARRNKKNAVPQGQLFLGF